ncbi:hypothetical protein AAVH_09123 [Aphelenchoides avenae]|nr:hypothetical protein AAVH_09123 [Aphelenchus avenae]
MVTALEFLSFLEKERWLGKSYNESVLFLNPRNYGCWQDANVNDGAPYAICKKKVAGNVTVSSRYFYYQPEGPPTETPKPKMIRAAGSSQEASVETGENERKTAEVRQQRRPDRHA